MSRLLALIAAIGLRLDNSGWRSTRAAAWIRNVWWWKCELNQISLAADAVFRLTRSVSFSSGVDRSGNWLSWK